MAEKQHAPATICLMFDEAMEAAESALSPKSYVPGGSHVAYARKADSEVAPSL